MNTKKTTLLAVIAAFGLHADAQNLIQNGSFESPVIASNTVAIAIPTSWQGNASARIINGNYAFPDLQGPQEGQQFASVGNDGVQAIISQDFTIEDSGTYMLTWFESAGNAPGFTSPYSVTVLVGASVVTNMNRVVSANATWISCSLQLTLTPGTYTLKFSSLQPTPGGLSTQLDNVAIVQQPELNVNLYAGITITGQTNATYQIQYSNNLGNPTNWMTLTNLTLPSSPYLFFDASSAGQPQRFYRALLND